MTAILFVCLGNICRSPTAEAVFRAKAHQQGLKVSIDSAGTGDWHIGDPPDSRAIQVAQARNYDMHGLKARQLRPTDFDKFDYILAMDRQNLKNIKALAPKNHKANLALFLSYTDQADKEVPDPYFGGTDGFDHVLSLIEAASDGLIAEIRSSQAAKS